MWVAPNVITLSGFGFIGLKCVSNAFSSPCGSLLSRSVVALSLYAPDLIGPGPSWLYMSFAAGLFLYQTFDSMFFELVCLLLRSSSLICNIDVDGKQARRTGTSSALGS